MKIIKITAFLILSLLATTSFAGSTTQQSDILAAQVNVTKDALNQMLNRLKDAPKSQLGSNPDFVDQAEAFNKKIEAAMPKFEARLKEILAQATFYVDRLNAIKDSKAYTDEQKLALLQDQTNVAKVVFEDLSKQYQKEVTKLFDLGFDEISYQLIPLDLYRGSCNHSPDYYVVNIKSPDKRIDGITTKAYGDVDYSDCDGNGSLRDDFKIYDPSYYYVEKIRNIYFADQIRKGCYSASCLALTSNHRLAYLSLLSNDIDKNISFTVTLNYSLSAYVGSSREFTLTLEAPRVSTNVRREYISLRQGESSDLPFEISEREYQEIKHKETRQNTLGELKDALLNPPGNFWSNWQCPAKADELKAQLCTQTLGCLTSSEIETLTNAIKEASVFDKKARIACLNSR